MIYLTNGNMPLNAAYADEIVQEDNSTYQLSFRFPTSDSLWEQLKEEAFLTADDLHGEQDFVIFEVEKKHGYIQVYAKQVFTLLNNYVVSSLTLDRATGSTALSRFAGAITRDNPFSFFSDIEDRHTFNISSKNAMEAFAKDKHSIIGQWGGDLVRHGYQVRLLKNGGSENESLFMYKKNLSSYQHKTSTKSLKTRITFIATVKGEGEKAPDRKLSVVVDSPLINKYSQIYEDVIEVNDRDVKDEASLRKYGEQYYRTSLCDMMEDSLELDVVGQSDVPVQMFDIVSLFHDVYNLDLRKKITKYTYSPMGKKLKTIGFGQFKSGLANAIGNAVSDAFKGEAQQLQDDFERQLARELKNADLAFDRKTEELKNEFEDGLNATRAKAEEVKRELSDTINQRFDSFDNGPLQEVKRRAEEALRNAGASTLLAQEAKRIGLDSVAKLEEFKRQATSAQTAFLGDLDVLKRTIANDIRPKQAQAEAEIAKQVEALNKTKNELAGVKSAQATYEETTTRRLSELTNLANGKASKSELTQTAEELASKIASMQVGGRNYIRGTRRMALASGLWTSGTFRPSGVGTAKTIEVSNSPATGFDKAIRLTSSNARNQIGIAQDRFEIMPGTYTMSVWVKGSVGQRVKLQTHWEPDDETGISPYFILKDDKWTYLTFSSERKKAGTVSIGYVYLVNADAGEYLDVLAPQLENGSLATSPKEAPEDTDVQISAVESTFKQRADSLEAGVNRLTEGFRTKADISALNVTAENIRQSVKRLETDTQNKLNQKLSLAEFEVRAGSIRQEILNATKDKADKTLVVAEAGKLREEFSKMKVGSRNYAEDYDFSRGLWYYTQGDNSPQDWTISNGEYNVKGTTNTWKQMQIYSKEGSITSGKSSTALLELELGETYTLSFQGICYSGSSSVWLSLRANRTVSDNPEIMHDNFNLTSSWQTYQVTIPALIKPENFDFWRIILGYNEIGHVAFRKVELTRSSTRIDAGPAPEDGKTDLVVAKSEFEKTAEGLSAKMTAVERYVNQDGQRQESLQRYAREESAKQATAVRELVAKDYVGKATYQETVRAIENKFESITNPQNGSIATQIANYKKSVDGRFADITSLIAGKANQTDFQRVKETSQLYERILGNTENSIVDKVSRMALTNQLFQVELAKNVGAGHNYIKNADFRAGNKNWNESVKPGLNFNYNHSSSNRGKPGVHIYGATDAVYYGLQQRIKFEILEGDIFTVSFLISRDGASTYSGLNLGVHYRKNNEIISQKWVSIPNSDIPGFKYKKMSFSFVTPKDIDELNLMLYGEQGKTINLYISEVKLERGSFATDFTLSPEDIEEAIRTVQTQLAGSWSVQNINSAGDLISGINLGSNGQNRITGKLTHITGETLIDNAVIKSAMIDKLKTANFETGSVTTKILDAEAVTAEKLKVDNALIRKITANEAFIDQLTSKRIFATRIESVISRSTVLDGYKGWIGGFQLGTHDSGSGRWLTGRNHFSVGMGDGEGGSGQTALWVNWGSNWSEPGYYAWFVKNNGKMYCYNTAEFWKTPIIHGDLKVTGRIRYDGGVWIYSGEYEKIGRSSKDYFYLEKASGARDWFPAWNDTSDRRLKSNIQESSVSGVDVINRLKTYSYQKEFNNEVEDISCGIMAQDVQKYAPDAFREGPDGIYTYNTFALVPYLIKAIQELNQKIEKMEKTIA